MSGYFYTTAAVVALGMVSFITYEFKKDRQKKQHPARAAGSGRRHPARQAAAGEHPALRQHRGGHDHGAAAAASDPAHPETAHRSDKRAGHRGHRANGSAVLVQQAAISQADAAPPVSGTASLMPAPVAEVPHQNPQLMATQHILNKQGKGHHHRRG